MTLDEMACDATQWFALRALVLSEQITAQRLVLLCRDHPDFNSWFHDSIEVERAEEHDEIADRISSA